jgi:hypothetical protein
MVRKSEYRKILLSLLMVVFVLLAEGGIVTVSYGQAETPTPTPTDGTKVPASATPPVTARLLNWSKPQNLAGGWFPDIATDVAGGVHVVWSASKEVLNKDNPGASAGKFFDVVLYSDRQNNGKWGKINDIEAHPSDNGSFATRPTLLMDRGGILHLTFRDADLYYASTPVTLASSASIWSSPALLSQQAYYSRMSIDSKGRIHLIYTANINRSDCVNCYHLYYRQSDDSGLTWSFPTDISLGSQSSSAKPQMLIDANDNIHVVWESGTGGDQAIVKDPATVMYAASNDGGASWGQAVQLFQNSTQARNVTIGEDGKGNLVVVAVGLPEDKVYYQVSKDHGQTWSSQEAIAGVLPGWLDYSQTVDDYAMATDSAGNIHLVMTGRTSEDPNYRSVLHLVWNGFQWSAPEAIVTLHGDVPEWPRIAVSNGNILNVVWFVRDQSHIYDSDHGNYQVWYADATASAPEEMPVAIPTLTPGPPATTTETAPTPTSIATSTPDPALEKIPINSGGPLSSENDDVLMILVSLVPALVLVAAVVVGVQIRRK